MPTCQGALGARHAPTTRSADVPLQAQRLGPCLDRALPRLMDDRLLAQFPESGGALVESRSGVLPVLAAQRRLGLREQGLRLLDARGEGLRSAGLLQGGPRRPGTLQSRLRRRTRPGAFRLLSGLQVQALGLGVVAPRILPMPVFKITGPFLMRRCGLCEACLGELWGPCSARSALGLLRLRSGLHRLLLIPGSLGRGTGLGIGA